MGSIRVVNVHISVFQVMLCACQKILHELLKKHSCRMYIVLQIIEVCSDERISEVPRVLSKNLIAYVEAEDLQILDHEHSSCSGIPLTERMNLPDA